MIHYYLEIIEYVTNFPLVHCVSHLRVDTPVFITKELSDGKKITSMGKVV